MEQLLQEWVPQAIIVHVGLRSGTKFTGTLMHDDDTGLYFLMDEDGERTYFRREDIEWVQ